MKKSIYFLFTVLLLASLFFGINVTSAAGPVVLKTVSYTPPTHPFMEPMGHEWIKRINEGLEGKVRIKYLGSSEVIPSKEQIEAIRNNVVQVGLLPAAPYARLLPEAISLVLTRYNPTEMRKSGFYDLMVELHERIGVRYLGPFHWGQFWMWSKKPINKLEDLKGIKMRTFALYDRFQRALGITPVTVAPAEVYTALERGVVDGFCFPLVGPRKSGWIESTKYIIAHPFYTLDLVILMNLSTWNKLPKPVQDKIEEVTANYEPDMVAHLEKMLQEEWKFLAKEGVKKIILSPEEAEKFVETAYRVKWGEIAEKVPADLIPKLKKLSGN